MRESSRAGSALGDDKVVIRRELPRRNLANRAEVIPMDREDSMVGRGLDRRAAGGPKRNEVTRVGAREDLRDRGSLRIASPHVEVAGKSNEAISKRLPFLARFEQVTDSAHAIGRRNPRPRGETELASQVAAGGAEREHGAAGQEVVQRLLLDRVDAEARGAAVGREHHRVAVARAHEARAALALVQAALARAEVALDAAVVHAVPPAARVASAEVVGLARAHRYFSTE
jgi:hypothetical protein